MSRIILILLLFYSPLTIFSQKSNWIIPSGILTDIDNRVINAHSGGIIFHNGIYYWYGEYKGDSTYLNSNIRHWECYRADHKGVSCYSSKNLINWKFEGVVLQPSDSPDSELHKSNVLERPKVIYNEKTGKFVMWMHIDNADYSWARAGVAIADLPCGPFTFICSFKPNGQNSKDMTLFKDSDGKAYQIYSSEGNQTMHISLLSEDYLKPSGIFTRILINGRREAPALFKYKEKYFLITSGLSGWDPNEAQYATADSVFGPWYVKGNPCSGKNSQTAFGGQCTFIFQVEGKQNLFIAMFDKWNKKSLIDSRYIWLPFSVNPDNTIDIKWKRKWKME